MNSKILFSIYSSILMIVSISSIYLDVDNKSYNIILLALSAIQLLYFFIESNKGALRGYYMRPTYLLILGLCIVNFQNIINILFEYGIPSNYFSYSNFRHEIISKSLFIAIIAQCALTVGYINANTYTKKFKNIYVSYKPFVVLMIISFLGFISTIDIHSFLSGTDYVGSGAFNRTQSTSSYFEQLLIVFLVITVAIKICSLSQQENISIRSYIKSFPIIFWAIFASYLFLRLVSGDRGPVIYNILLMFYGYIYVSKKKLRLIVLASFIIAGMLLVTFLNVFRGNVSGKGLSERISESLDSYNIEQTYSKSVFPAAQELANSYGCTAVAIGELGSGRQQYGYGKYNLYSLALSIPGSNFIMSKLGVNQREYQTGEIITTAMLGRQYNYGMGTTSIAAIYFDFGTIGIVFGFLLFGYIFKKVDSIICLSKNSNIIIMILTLYLSIYSIYIPRASFTSILSKAIYAVIVFYVLYLIVRMFHSQRKIII